MAEPPNDGWRVAIVLIVALIAVCNIAAKWPLATLIVASTLLPGVIIGVWAMRRLTK